MTGSSLRAIAYLRQSAERSGETADTSLSLDSQETRFHAWCAANDAAPIGVIRDHDMHGDDPTRPGLAELRVRVAAEKPDVVWVFSMARFSRDFILQEMTWRELRKAGAKYLVSNIEAYTDDDFTRGIYGLISAKQLTELRAHLTAAFNQRATRGEHHGPAPYGYRRAGYIEMIRADGSVHRRNTGPLVIEPTEALILTEIVERFLAGEAMLAIAWSLQNRGVPSRGGDYWQMSTIKKILISPVAAGAVWLHGEVRAWDAHPAIIDRETWERVQARMANLPVIKRKARTELVTWLEGYVRHACGERMYLYGMQPRNGVDLTPMLGCRRSYGAQTVRCTIERRHIVVTKAENVARACLAADFESALSVKDAVAAAREAAGGKDAARAMKALEQRRETARKRHDRARERYLAGRESFEWMDGEDARLAAELATIAAESATLPTPPDPARFQVVGEQLGTLGAVIRLADDATMREILTTVGHLVIGPDGGHIAYAPEFAPFFPHPTLVPVPRGKRLDVG